MRKIKTWRDPYDRGFSTTRLKTVEIHEGVTILVGCNGSGKSTLLKNIEEVLKAENIPVILYDNASDYEKDQTLYGAMRSGSYGLLATTKSSSEGENISAFFGTFASGLRNFIINGETASQSRSRKLQEAFANFGDKGKIEEKYITSDERWILLDAMDSGYSIDNAIQLKSLFDIIIEDGKKHNKQVYIVCSANAYELCSESDCFDVMAGKYIRFTDYNDYKKFIMHTADLKKRRYDAEEARDMIKNMRQRLEPIEREDDAQLTNEQSENDAKISKEFVVHSFD